MNGPPDSIPWSSALRTLATQFGEGVAVYDGQARLSYAMLSARAHALAARLALAGVKPGEPVATLLPNSVHAVWASYGTTLCGAAETPLSWSQTPEEIAWSARLARFRMVVTRRERVDALRAQGLEPIAVEDLTEADTGIVHPPVPAGAWGRILFTSGTTGRPKGVVYTHGKRWLGEQALQSALPFAPAPGSRMLLMTPFPHGASLLTFAWCAYGGEVVLLDGVDTQAVGDLLRSSDMDAVFAPPTVMAKLAAAFGSERFAGVRCIFTGTQPLAAALYEKVVAMFGPVVRITYGKSECTNPITVLGPSDTQALYALEKDVPGACVGWASAGVELQIRAADDPADAEPTQPGTQAREGEVWLRARHMCDGMLEEGGYAPHPDGWHRTGDLGRIDARGRLWLTGRIADVIKTGGYRVNPDEIEACLSGMQSCERVCVTSLPSEYWGEVIVAVAENTSGDWVAEAATRLDALSRHKRPRAYASFAALPRNPQGKISRRKLRELIAATHEFIDGPYPALMPSAGIASYGADTHAQS